MHDDTKEFEQQTIEEIQQMKNNKQLRESAISFITQPEIFKYSYHFHWMGIPIIQYPQDIVQMQELIFQIKPDIIIETGVARGGSVVFYSSMLELLGNNGIVIGIDIDIRPHNRKRIEEHTMFKNIRLIEGSSIDDNIYHQVKNYIEKHPGKTVLVALDSSHAHEHVLDELKLYSSFVSKGSYIVVFDTIAKYLNQQYVENRPWSLEKNPYSAVQEFLTINNRFMIDEDIESKLLFTAAPQGYLRCIK